MGLPPLGRVDNTSNCLVMPCRIALRRAAKIEMDSNLGMRQCGTVRQAMQHVVKLALFPPTLFSHALTYLSATPPGRR